MTDLNKLVEIHEETARKLVAAETRVAEMEKAIDDVLWHARRNAIMDCRGILRLLEPTVREIGQETNNQFQDGSNYYKKPRILSGAAQSDAELRIGVTKMQVVDAWGGRCHPEARGTCSCYHAGMRDGRNVGLEDAARLFESEPCSHHGASSIDHTGSGCVVPRIRALLEKSPLGQVSGEEK